MIAPWLALALQEELLLADDTGEWMKRLALYVEENHLKKDPKREQRGMTYEYFDVKRKGQADQWVQGEALDTMHDGAWFGAALVEAFRATGDNDYRDWLARWTIPFYCKMLNRSDIAFEARAMYFIEQEFILFMPERFSQAQHHHALHRMLFEHSSVSTLLLTDQTANWCLSVFLTDHAGGDRDATWRPQRK